MDRPEPAAARLLAWARTGGRAPADDERLDLDDDGAFRATRTVAGARIGSFEGRLPRATVEDLRREVAACRGAGELWLDTPRDGATETVTFADDDAPAASLGSNARPGAPWAALVQRLRGLADDVVADPAAALELVAGPAGARLVAVGPGSLDLDLSSIVIQVVRQDAAGVPVGRWQAATGDPGPGWTVTGPGWSHDLPFDHGLAAVSGEWLQVWVFARVRDGAERTARLFLAVPGAR